MPSERYEVPPERLARWLERWAERHGEATRTEIGAARVTFTAPGGASVSCEPPFPPLPAAALGTRDGMAAGPLLEHVARQRTVGVVLVRLGGFAVGVFAGERLLDSKVGRRQVHGRHRAGGSSSGRFARRREGQARAALEAAADVCARVVLPWAARGRLDAVVTGGDRRALEEVLGDRRLSPVAALAVERVLDVPDPRQAVLRDTPRRFRATVVCPRAR